MYAKSARRPLTEGDVEAIARGQIELEDAASASQPSLVVQDTDLISTVVYARHYYGACPEWIVEAARLRVAPIYLLSDIDIQWVGDDVRDRPLERKVLDSLFRQALAEFDANVAPLSGLGINRLRNAIKLINDLRALLP
jgi:nicotinamide riboside kinase